MTVNDSGSYSGRLAFLSVLRDSDGPVLWHKPLTGASAVAAVSNGLIYLTFDGTGPVHASVYDGTLYVTSFTTLLPSPVYYYDATSLYALNARTGVEYWHSRVARTNYVVAVADGLVYVHDTGPMSPATQAYCMS